MPIFYEYDDYTDLDEHIRIFMNQMAFYTSSDLIWCRSFFFLLKGEALVGSPQLPWYNYAWLGPPLSSCPFLRSSNRSSSSRYNR